MHIVADGPVRTSAGSNSQQGFDLADTTASSKYISPPHQLRILIVEDETCIAMQLEDMVQNLGHEVVGSVASHAQAIASAQTSRPDLALMDINLDRGGSGIEAALELRRRFNVPSIFVSAYLSFPSTRERAQAAQPLGFVPKPYTEREIEAALKQAADQLR
jgi:CheY-like chemotaxis protein